MAQFAKQTWFERFPVHYAPRDGDHRKVRNLVTPRGVGCESTTKLVLVIASAAGCRRVRVSRLPELHVEAKHLLELPGCLKLFARLLRHKLDLYALRVVVQYVVRYIVQYIVRCFLR